MTLNYISFLIKNYKEYELSQNLKKRLLEIPYSNWNLKYVNFLKANLLKQVLLTNKYYQIFSLLWWFSIIGFILGLIANILYLVLGLVYSSISSFFILNITFWIIYFFSVASAIIGRIIFTSNVMRDCDIYLLIKNTKIIFDNLSEEEKTTLLPKWIKKAYDEDYFSLTPIYKKPNKHWNVYNIFKFKKNLKIWIISHHFLIQIIDFCIEEKLLRPILDY